jgi:hypothetical protein
MFGRSIGKGIKMQSDTFQTILKLSDERFELYRLAGHQHLVPDQVGRINEITGRLSVLWDQYRRELAADSRETRERIAAQARYAQRDAAFALDEEERRAA